MVLFTETCGVYKLDGGVITQKIKVCGNVNIRSVKGMIFTVSCIRLIKILTKFFLELLSFSVQA